MSFQVGGDMLGIDVGIVVWDKAYVHYGVDLSLGFWWFWGRVDWRCLERGVKGVVSG